MAGKPKKLSENTTAKIPAQPEGAAKRSGKPTLVLIAGNAGLMGEQYEISKPSLTIGRYKTSDIWIDDQSLSKIHARVSYLETGISITDLGTTNGTLVNGKKIPAYVPYVLRNNDEIKLGAVILKFHENGLPKHL